MKVAPIALIVALSGCVNHATTAHRNLQTWVGASIEAAASSMGSPKSAQRLDDGSVAYDWRTDTVCVDMGYQLIGSSIVPSRPCSIGCSWTVTTSREGAIRSATLNSAEVDSPCPIPSVNESSAPKYVGLGALHTHKVTFVSESDRDSFFRQATACDDRFKSGERVRWALLDGTPGLWPVTQGCCIDQVSAACVPYPARKSLFDLL